MKLAFSVAAHLDSEIMIMDEVLAVGDIKFRQKCEKRMKELLANEPQTRKEVEIAPGIKVNFVRSAQTLLRCVCVPHKHL